MRQPVSILCRLGLLVVLVVTSTACNLAPLPAPTVTPPPPTAAPTSPPLPMPDYDRDRVETILAAMTPEEKVGQMFMLGYFDASPTLDIYQMVERGRPGGIVLFAHNVGNPEETATVTNRLQAIALETSNVPLLIATDQEGGIVSRLQEGFTAWPNVMALAATRDPALAEQVGAAIAEELHAVGINMDLAPVADVLTNPANTVIGVRSFGSVPQLVSTFSTAMMRGLHSGGLIATAKHFPGHGGTADDSHLLLPSDNRSRAELEESLTPFVALIDAGVDAVMTAHVVYPALSGDGQAATLSDEIVTGLLREELGFDGVILSDALSMGAVMEQYTLEQAVERAIRAGVDMLTFGRGVSPERQLAAIAYVVRLMQLGILDEARIDDSVRRILALKSRYGLLDWSPLDPAAVDFDLAAHQALSYEVAAYAVTLLHDRAGLLPLDADGVVTVVYPMTASGAPPAFRAYDPDVNLIGVSPGVAQADRDGVMAAAEAGGTVVVLTQDVYTNAGQAALVRGLPPERTVAVAIRSPYDLLAYPEVQTYLLTYSGGDQALSALARMLYGRVGAPGRIPVDLP
jgi:beta-N-acetylhexosaminidase